MLDGQLASCAADDAWLGVRGRPGVLKGRGGGGLGAALAGTGAEGERVGA